MFIGHFGVAMAAKGAAPTTSLGTLILASQWIDLVWPLLLLAGIEHVAIVPGHLPASPLDFTDYPWTHSLVAVLGWSLLLGALAALRGGRRAAIVVAALVLSHWLLDVAAHAPDLPLWPQGPRVGLGLWNSVPGTLAVEFALLALGASFYVRTTRPRDVAGTVLVVALVLVLSALYLGALFGPPPPSVRVLALSALSGWLFVGWGYWIDRHRTLREPA